MTETMRLKISHKTSYRYDKPVGYALQQLRLTPKERPGQKVLSWDTEVKGGTLQVSFDDQHYNHVELISLDADATEIVVSAIGEVEIQDTAGVFGQHSGYVPLWFFRRATALTRPGPLTRRLVRDLDSADGDLPRLHGLMDAVLDAVAYAPGSTDAGTPAEDVMEAEKGVCQDHAHVFVTAARLMGFPARYVSGYLMMPDRTEQDATHAWAEAYVEGLGWVGFDVSNQQCPDARYVRIATGLDYADAAPIQGMRFGTGEETLSVTVSVEGKGQKQSQTQTGGQMGQEQQ